MKNWLFWGLITLLALSLTGNLYLWNVLSRYNVADNPLPATNGSQIQPVIYPNQVSSIKDKPNLSHTTSTENTAPPLTDITIDALSEMLEAGDFQNLSSALSYQLKQDPLNEKLLLIEAELIRQTQPLSSALIHYYDLADLPLSRSALNEINSKIDTLYQQAQTQLRKDKQWELVAKLNEPLYQRLPEARTFALNLAEAYAYQEKLTLMEDTLASLPFEDSAAQALRELAYSNGNTQNETNVDDNHSGDTNIQETRVALAKHGDQYRVSAQALNQKVTMILDTGASTTAISSALYARLKKVQRLKFIGNFTVNTASGSIEAPFIQIPAFYFAGYTFTDMSAIVLPEGALPYTDGLLGMNVLGPFDFSILPQESTLVLRERP
ncbi:MAG: hypothetical protein AXW14_02310 [Alteromonas sp. Nap_26]|nr:MAG: hypothetical protein AXW14_02310 [Alteromonas sp. Nap_26]